VVRQLAPSLDHGQPAVVVAFDPGTRAHAHEGAGDSSTDGGDGGVDRGRGQALGTVGTADIEVKLGRTCPDTGPCIRGQRLGRQRQPRMVAVLAATVEAGLDQHRSPPRAAWNTEKGHPGAPLLLKPGLSGSGGLQHLLEALARLLLVDALDRRHLAGQALEGRTVHLPLAVGLLGVLGLVQLAHHLGDRHRVA
jgi:hypothetical protein